LTRTPYLVSTPPPSRSTQGRLIYAVGDVHGNLDLLEALVAEIAKDALVTNPDTRPILIFVGDYLDRGAASAGVIDLVLALRRRPAFEVRTLKGNHEEAMLTFLEDARFGPTWVQFGGAETLASYGVAPPGPRADAEAWEEVRKAFAAAVPREHLEFLESLELLIVIGDYAFAHAGIDPRSALDQQTERNLLWIRDEFLSSRLRHGKIVVHGHSAAMQPEVLPYRVGIDTGAYASGVLTALRLEGDSQKLIQVHAEPGLGH
jgi:serine/threonine protein phosphatase 1